jgi:hypothetical protein
MKRLDRKNRPLPGEFRARWRALARQGKCDVLDSVQFVRLLAEWLERNRPTPVGAWIITEANRKGPMPPLN